MFCVYIIQSQTTGKFYIGQTSDLLKRLQRHASGGNIYTRRRGPFKLIYSEEFSTRGEAMKREKQIKNYKGGNKFKKLIERAGDRAANCIPL